MQSISVNLNDLCRVRLTPIGQEALKNYCLNLHSGNVVGAERMFQTIVKGNPNGIVEMHFHELLQYFGSHFVHGADYRILPFVDNAIVFVR